MISYTLSVEKCLRFMKIIPVFTIDSELIHSAARELPCNEKTFKNSSELKSL